jgi:hypothetical protein
VDGTGLVDACRIVRGTIVGDSMTRAEVQIANPPSSTRALQVVWVIGSCDVGAALLFSSAGPAYDLTVERDVAPPCTPGTGLLSVQLELSQPVLAEVVTGHMFDPEGPSPTRHPADESPAAGTVPDCPGATGDADIADTYLGDNEAPSWASDPPDPQASVQPGLLAAVATDLPDWPVAIVLLDTSTGSICRLAGLPPDSIVRGLAWSPAGDALAITTGRATSNAAQVLIWSSIGMSRAWLGDQVPEVAWSPDGSKLAVASDTRGATIINGAGGDSAISDRPSERPLWSPDANQVAFWEPAGPSGPGVMGSLTIVSLQDGTESLIPDGNVEPVGWLDADTLLMFDRATGAIRTLPLKSVVDSSMWAQFGHAFSNPAIFTADLAYAATLEPDETGPDLMAYGSDGFRLKLSDADVLGATTHIAGLAWSPGGDRVVFTAADLASGTSRGVWSVNRDGTDLRQLTERPLDLIDGRATGDQVDRGAWQPIWR